MIDKLFHYKAEILDVHDGDSIKVILDLGLSTKVKTSIRMLSINAPELSGKTKPDGIKSRDALIALLTDKDGKFKPVIVETIKDTKREKYGRLLGIIWVLQDDGSYLNANQWMVDNNYAIDFMVE